MALKKVKKWCLCGRVPEQVVGVPPLVGEVERPQIDIARHGFVGELREVDREPIRSERYQPVLIVYVPRGVTGQVVAM